MARLNKNQKEWVKKFRENHPFSTEIKYVFKDLGDKVVGLAWESNLPVCAIPDCLDWGIGKTKYLLEVRLRPSGKLRNRPNYSYSVEFPRCNLKPVAFRPTMEQQILPFGELLNYAVPRSPVKYRESRSPNEHQKQQSNHLVKYLQLSLPLFGIAAQLQEFNLAKGYPVTSQEEILSEQEEHYDLEKNRIVKLPKAICSILKEKQASLSEWDSAISLYRVAGSQGAMTYLEGIDFLRMYKSSKISTVSVRPSPQSISVSVTASS